MEGQLSLPKVKHCLPFSVLWEQLCELHQVVSFFTSSLYADSSPFMMRPTTVVSSGNLIVWMVICRTPMCQDCEKKRTQNTSLWWSSSLCDGVGCSVVLTVCLLSSLKDPIVGASTYSQQLQFLNQVLWQYSIECQTVNKQNSAVSGLPDESGRGEAGWIWCPP